MHSLINDFKEVDVVDILDFLGKWSMVGQVPGTRAYPMTYMESRKV